MKYLTSSHRLLVFAILALFAGLTALTAGEDNGGAILQKSLIAMGSGNLNSIQYSGSGKAGTLGQSLTPDAPWPTLNVNSYTRTIEYTSQSSREEMVRTLENPPAKGGGAPFQGQQKQVNIVAGLYAWNQPGENPQPAPAALEERQLQLLSTPHGFLKEALISTTIGKKVKGGTEVSYTAFGRFKVSGLIDSKGMNYFFRLQRLRRREVPCAHCAETGRLHGAGPERQ
jgi:hypothetical protein